MFSYEHDHNGSWPIGIVEQVLTIFDAFVGTVKAGAANGSLTCNVRCISQMEGEKGEVSESGRQAHFRGRDREIRDSADICKHLFNFCAMSSSH